MLTSSQEDSRARVFLKQENDEEQPTLVGSGQKCIESFERLPHVSSWRKMFVDSLIGKGEWHSNKCWLTWKMQVTKLSQYYFQLAPSAPRIEETECGLLPTPQVFDATGGMIKGKEYNGATKHAEKLGQAINRRMLPTPRAQDNGQNRNFPERGRSLAATIEPVAGTRGGLKLQPDFAGWMMGYPKGYLDLEAGEMPPSKRTGMQSSPR